MANSAWPYQLLTPAGYALKITFFEKLYLPEGHKYNSHEFFWPWLLYWDSLPIYHIFLTDYFQRSIHKMPSMMEVGKDNWCYVGTCAKLFSMRCHRNRLCSFLGGLSQRVVWWIADSSGIKLLILAEPCYCSCHSCCQLKEKILECSALMESLHRDCCSGCYSGW